MTGRTTIQKKQKKDQARADAGTISLPAFKPGEVSVQAEEQARLFALEAAKADQARADAGTISLPAAKPGEVSLQAEEQARLFALEAAKADQARADAGTVSLPAVSERDKLMASLPEHLQTEPKPGTPDWDYWNTMVQLHIKRLNRSRTSWGKRP